MEWIGGSALGWCQTLARFYPVSFQCTFSRPMAATNGILAEGGKRARWLECWQCKLCRPARPLPFAPAAPGHPSSPRRSPVPTCMFPLPHPIPLHPARPCLSAAPPIPNHRAMYTDWSRHVCSHLCTAAGLAASHTSDLADVSPCQAAECTPHVATMLRHCGYGCVNDPRFSRYARCGLESQPSRRRRGTGSGLAG